MLKCFISISTVLLFAIVGVGALASYAPDKEAVANEQLLKLNQLYKGIDAFCDAPARNFHADLVADCKAFKSEIRAEFKSRLGLVVSKKLDDGLETVCLQDARQRAEALNVGYLTGDSCAQVLAKIEASGR